MSLPSRRPNVQESDRMYFMRNWSNLPVVSSPYDLDHLNRIQNLKTQFRQYLLDLQANYFPSIQGGMIINPALVSTQDRLIRETEQRLVKLREAEQYFVHAIYGPEFFYESVAPPVPPPLYDDSVLRRSSSGSRKKSGSGSGKKSSSSDHSGDAEILLEAYRRSIGRERQRQKNLQKYKKRSRSPPKGRSSPSRSSPRRKRMEKLLARNLIKGRNE